MLDSSDLSHPQNDFVSSRASKRTRGAIQNIANQLAQIAAGWEAQFDGRLLLGEPDTGSDVMDLVRRVSTVNGREANLGMAAILDKWLEGELDRLARNRDWLGKATVEVGYELVPSDAFMGNHPSYWTSQALVANLSAKVSVATLDGTAEASFKNWQAVVGKTADPGPVPGAGTAESG